MRLHLAKVKRRLTIAHGSQEGLAWPSPPAQSSEKVCGRAQERETIGRPASLLPPVGLKVRGYLSRPINSIFLSHKTHAEIPGDWLTPLPLYGATILQTHFISTPCKKKVKVEIELPPECAYFTGLAEDINPYPIPWQFLHICILSAA